MTASPSTITRYAQDTRGVISVLTAVVAVAIIAFTGLAADLGSAVYWQQRLQSATDSAALAASFDSERVAEIATEALAANGPVSAVLEETDTGDYVDDPGIADTARFTTGGVGNAVRLVTRYDVPMYFLALLTGNTTMEVTASAIAYNEPLAGIAIGTGAESASIVELNSTLGMLANASFNLTEAERDALDATRISAFRLFDQFAQQLGSPTMSIDAVMASSIDLRQLAESAAAALSAQAPQPTADEQLAISALNRIAQDAGDAPPVTVEDFVGFGAHRKRAARDLVSARTDSLGVPGLSLLVGYAQVAQENQLLDLDEVIPLPGLATVTIETVVARGAYGSTTPGLSTIGPAGSSAFSSQGRVRLNVELLNPIVVNLGLVQLSLPLSFPLIVDVGYGSATIEEISCGTDILETTDIAVSAQSGAVRFYVGSVTENELTDLLTPLAPIPAEIVGTPLVSLTANGEGNVAPSDLETLHFSHDDIEQGTRKTTHGTPTSDDAIEETNSQMDYVVENAPPGSGTLITDLVRPQVTAVMDALAPQIDEVLALVGLRSGYMDVRATAARCGIPALVT
jgi:uncharacterized membrane protein